MNMIIEEEAEIATGWTDEDEARTSSSSRVTYDIYKEQTPTTKF